MVAKAWRAEFQVLWGLASPRPELGKKERRMEQDPSLLETLGLNKQFLKIRWSTVFGKLLWGRSDQAVASGRSAT